MSWFHDSRFKSRKRLCTEECADGNDLEEPMETDSSDIDGSNDSADDDVMPDGRKDESQRLNELCALNSQSIILYSALQVLHGHQRDDEAIENFCDAQFFRTHPLFSRDPTALQLIVYYDEVEVTNPLGRKTGKRKLGNEYIDGS